MLYIYLYMFNIYIYIYLYCIIIWCLYIYIYDVYTMFASWSHRGPSSSVRPQGSTHCISRSSQNVAIIAFSDWNISTKTWGKTNTIFGIQKPPPLQKASWGDGYGWMVEGRFSSISICYELQRTHSGMCPYPSAMIWTTVKACQESKRYTSFHSSFTVDKLWKESTYLHCNNKIKL